MLWIFLSTPLLGMLHGYIWALTDYIARANTRYSVSSWRARRQQIEDMARSM